MEVGYAMLKKKIRASIFRPKYLYLNLVKNLMRRMFWKVLILRIGWISQSTLEKLLKSLTSRKNTMKESASDSNFFETWNRSTLSNSKIPTFWGTRTRMWLVLLFLKRYLCYWLRWHTYCREPIIRKFKFFKDQQLRVINLKTMMSGAVSQIQFWIPIWTALFTSPAPTRITSPNQTPNHWKKPERWSNWSPLRHDI